MHDRDELCLESGLYITGNVFDRGGDGIPGCKGRVDDYTKAFDLEVSLV